MFACSWRALSHHIEGPAPAGLPITAVAHWRGAAGGYYYFGRAGGVVATGHGDGVAQAALQQQIGGACSCLHLETCS